MNKNVFLRLRNSSKREELIDIIKDLKFTSFGSNQLGFVINNLPEEKIEDLKSCNLISRIYFNTIPNSTITSYSDLSLKNAAKRWNKYNKNKQYELPGTNGIRDYLGL